MLMQFLIMLVAVPVLGFVCSLLTPRKLERTIFTIAIATMLSSLAVFVALGYQWLGAGSNPLQASIGSLHLGDDYTFHLDFYFDKLAAVFWGMAAVVTGLIFVFSKYYLHREQGFKRFYSTVLLFFIGLSLVILAGNFEVLFIGWELIGISSVLLIAFYRDRFLPARNALKVFSVYRIGDAFLFGAIWYAHHIFGGDINFSELSGFDAQHGNIVILGLLLLIVAMVKSAQFPFSYWLPRAMEGPTTSSAIFYGALSVHMGLFLLLRTYPLWEDSVWVRTTVVAAGLVTAIIASSIARAQSSIKTQIAYASIAQIGIMFIELALGLHWLVLLHFVSNASLRMYQLLISPSVVSYLVHDQFFNFVPPRKKIKNTFMGRFRATLYVLGVKEWNMNAAARRYLWKPLKSIGRACALLDSRLVQGISLIVFLLLLLLSAMASSSALLMISTIAAIVSIGFYIRSYATKGSARNCWDLIMLGHLFGALFLVLASGGHWKYFVMYSIGLVAAFIVGHVCLWYLQAKGETGTLRDYYGSIYAFPKLGNFFFIVLLNFMVFPIGLSFLAQEVMASMISLDHTYQIVFLSFSYLLLGLSAMRLYTKVFFGPHKTSHHEIAYRSS